MGARMRHGRPMTKAEIKQADTPRGAGDSNTAPWPMAISPCAFPIDCGMGLQCPTTEVVPVEWLDDVVEAAREVIKRAAQAEDKKVLTLTWPDLIVGIAGLHGAIEEHDERRGN